jgi:adenylate cyclase
MGVEIERKFLVATDGWRDSVISTHDFIDGLLARVDGGKIRVRLGNDRAWIAIKGERNGLSRAEFEYEIPLPDAEQMLALCIEPLIKKTRHCVACGGQVWSVDVHDDLLGGLVLAEIELEHEAQPVALPDWLGREVTGDPRFRKGELVKHHARAEGSVT